MNRSHSQKLIVIGIDIGSTWLRACACLVPEKAAPKALKICKLPLTSIKAGNITDPREVGDAILQAIETLEKETGGHAVDINIGVSGSHIGSITSKGVTTISRGDQIASTFDIDAAQSEAAKSIHDARLKYILHTIPISYRVDGLDIPGTADGVRGTKLEVKTLFVTYPHIYMDTVKRALALASLDETHAYSGILAEGHAILSKRQKQAGVALVNIGSQVTSLAIYKESNPIHVCHIAWGGDDITQDIALTLRVSLEEAEEIKCGRTLSYQHKQIVDSIIIDHLDKVCHTIAREIDAAHVQQLLYAGIRFSGDGSQVPHLATVAREVLSLPAKIISDELAHISNDSLIDPAYATAYGLTAITPTDHARTRMSFTLPRSIRSLFDTIRKFLP